MILIITNKEDSHPTPVINYLKTLGVEVFRLNTECLLTDYEFSWWNNAEKCDFHIRNTVNRREVWGHEVTAVWERRPEKPEKLPFEIRKEIDKHNREETLGFLSFLLYYLGDVYSIGHHFYEWRAGSKMVQLQVAMKLGLKVPATCLSNRKQQILDFAKPYEYVILKSIEDSNVWLGDEMEYVFYAQKVKSSLLEEQPEEAFSQTVSFVQNYVEKAFELRITVVGDDVFAAKIDSQALDEDKGKVDWRQGYDYGLKHTAFTLPDDIADKCRAYLRHFHLRFGCFDFIVTPTGDYVFLECNPNGQWLWIEEALPELKIAESIADLLLYCI